MDKTRNYKIIPELKLIIVISIGEFKLNKIGHFIDHLNNDPLFKKEYNFIFDIRHTKIKADLDITEQLSSNAVLNKLFSGKRKDVFITDTPDQVIIPHLLKNKSKKLPLNIDITSSLEAAAKILDISGSVLRSEFKTISSQKFKKNI